MRNFQKSPCMIKKLLILGGAIFFGQKAYNAIYNAAYSRVDWELGRPLFDWSQMMFTRLIITLPITITNNNPIRLTVTSVVGEIWYGSTKLSDVNIPSPLALDPGVQRILNLRMEVQIPNLLNDVLVNIQQNGTYTTLVNRLIFKGLIKTNIINVPLETTIPIA